MGFSVSVVSFERGTNGISAKRSVNMCTGNTGPTPDGYNEQQKKNDEIGNLPHARYTKGSFTKVIFRAIFAASKRRF